MDPRWPRPSAKAAFNVGNLLKDADQLAEAATAYGLAAKGADDEVTGVAHLARAKCLVSLRDYSQALASFLKGSGDYKGPRPPTGSLAGNRPGICPRGPQR